VCVCACVRVCVCACVRESVKARLTCELTVAVNQPGLISMVPATG